MPYGKKATLCPVCKYKIKLDTENEIILPNQKCIHCWEPLS